MQKRKGFTLVELVIVIAVIAILAGVLIGTFASVINRANDSARLQELKAQEIEQKADDILKKIEDSGWYGWEDFETSIVKKMTAVYKDSLAKNEGTELTTEAITKAVKLAIEDYAKANANEKTSLTEDQVKAIVENTMGEIRYTGVTEPQVKAIIDSAQKAVKSSDVPASTVREIVDAANANNLSAPEVTKIITINIGNASSSNFDTLLAAAVAEIKAAQRSDADLKALIETLVPVTKHVASQTEFEDALKTLQSGSTIWLDVADADWTFAWPGSDQVKTFTLRGEAINTLTVNASEATLFVMNDVTTLDVEAIANYSIHTYGIVGTAIVEAGRYVVERKSVGTLTAKPGTNKTVSIEVGAGTSVNSLVAQYQRHGSNTNDTIQITNAGHVASAQLTSVDENWNQDNNTTNVRLLLKAGSTGLSTTTAGDVSSEQSISTSLKGVKFTVADENTDTTKEVSTTSAGVYHDDKTVESFWGALYATSFAGGDGSPENPYQISNATELARLSYLMISDSAANYAKKSYVLTSDIDLTGKSWMPISAWNRNTYKTTSGSWFAGNFDGAGYSITGLSSKSYASVIDGGYLGTNNSSVQGTSGEIVFGLFGSVVDATIYNLKLADVNIDIDYIIYDGKNYQADSVGALAGHTTGNVKISNIEVTGSVKGYDAVGGIIGRNRSFDDSKGEYKVGEVLIENCTNYASVTGTRVTSGIVGNLGKSTNATFSNCVNKGAVSILNDDQIHDKGSGQYWVSGIALINNGESIVNYSNCSNLGTLKNINSHDNKGNSCEGQIAGLFTVSKGAKINGNPYNLTDPINE